MDKTELLNRLEQIILIVAGNIRIHRMMSGPSGDTKNLRDTENHLGAMLEAVLELKKLEGIPSSLSIIDEK